jgi:nuclear pore complex protein Nup155
MIVFLLFFEKYNAFLMLCHYCHRVWIFWTDAGVFRDIVEWCLVVTTPEEAIICALARETNQSSDGLDHNSSKTKDSHLVLIPTRYEIPTDSVHILSVCGTDDGRIFMGGSDGCLYEMSYEANIPTTSAIGNSMFYNDEDFANDYEYFDSESVVKTIATSGKRALSSLVFGPISSVESRPRKCRKVNHSSFTSSIVSAFVPGFVLKAASAVFGTSPVLTGGPIVNLTLDSDRKTLYALTSRGYIHAFDLDTEITHGKMGCSDHCNPPKLACSVNVTKSVRRYLETVSHGRMYPPTTIGTDYSIASITFPGGGSGAQFGVGGMDGARAILKIADTEVLRKKTPSKSRKSTNGSISRSGSEGYLHPISIHVVPASESRYITLIAITSGGLRYYFSALPDAGTSYSSSSLRPGSRFTLCHIRAPPPLSMNGKNKVVLDHNFGKGVSTLADKNGKERKGTIAKGSYTSGVTILAINCDDRSGDDEVGESILAISPDYTQNGVVEMSSSKAGQAIANFPNGVNEILSLPIGTSLLPGGHVWDLKSRSLALQKCNSVLRLFFRSTTPSSLSQNDKLPPIFLAASNNRRFANKMFSSESTRDAANGTMKYIVPKSAGIAEVLRQILSGKSRIVTMPPGVSQRRMNAYQMLDRYGCENSGFSLPPKSTGNKGRKIPIAESPSLPFSVINPFPVALSEMSLQHLIIDSNFKDVLALNSGGIYHFVESSPINILHSLFSNSPASSIGSDERVKIFFKRYGHKESCAMCLSIAISPKTNIAIVRKAIQAALSYAYRPCFVRSSQAPGDTSIPAHGINVQPFSQPVHGSDIEGYSFLPSHLHDGLLSLTSRLLRPIWCKPALIVTEGRLIRHKSSGISEQLPAKVELLLNQKTLDDLRRPLAALQKLMKDIFEPAVKDIPGLRASDALMIDVTEDRELPRGTWITQALQYQIQSRHQHDSIPPQLTERELTAAARLREERSIHALYRLVSRTVQLLSLLDLIYRAHLSPHLPEVEFGYIHSKLSFFLTYNKYNVYFS